VYHTRYYLTANKNLLQKITFVFMDIRITVSPVVVYITTDECTFEILHVTAMLHIFTARLYKVIRMPYQKSNTSIRSFLTYNNEDSKVCVVLITSQEGPSYREYLLPECSP
jgi:hypothetical protein